MKLGWFTVMMMVSAPALAETAPVQTATNATQTKVFTGSPITLKMKDADIHDVLRLISEASGFNIVVSPGISGKVTVSLEDVPWDQALEVVMTTMKLSAERHDSVLRVVTTEKFIDEKVSSIAEAKLAAETAPLITRVFPISYCDLTELSKVLTDFMNPPSKGDSKMTAVMSASGSTILIDKNTQSLIVRDTAAGMEKIRKMISLLDVQTPEIIVDTKVIIASEKFAKDLDGKFSSVMNGAGAFLNGGLVGNPNIGPAGPTLPSNDNQFQFSIGNSLTLTAFLKYSESESKARVISSPRLMVLSGKSASILQGSNLPVPVTTINQGIPTTTIEFRPYATKLDVTPRATNDGSVFMKLELSRDTVETTTSGQAAIAPRNVKTEVVVDSGSTLVLGGVQNTDEFQLSAGFPFLRKIPLLGWLFGQEKSDSLKSEIMFFVTPRILNVKKTSIAEGGSEAQAPSASL